MRARFASNLSTLIVGALLMADRFAFGAGTARWLAFAGGGSVVVVTAAAFPIRGRGPGQRILDAQLVIVGAWTVISSLTYGLRTVGWLALGEGGACALLALAGLVAHELVMERGVAHPAAAFAPGDGSGADVPPDVARDRSASVAGSRWPSR